MLKRWSIENFKSFRDLTDIALAPITVFAGANSSGKSTIIQSILLLKQTVQYAPVNRPIALNGTLLKLGTFDDVKNASSSETYVGLGWDIEVEDLGQQLYRSTSQFNAWTFPLFYGQQTVKSISAEIKWDVAATPEIGLGAPSEAGREFLQLQPRLLSCSVKAVRNDEKLTTSYLSIERNSDSSISKTGIGRSFPFVLTDIDPESKAELIQSKPDGEVAGVASRHFFPAQIGVRFDAAKRRARTMAAIICGDESLYHWTGRELGNASVPQSVANLIESRLAGEDDLLSRHTDTAQDTSEENVPVETLMTRFRQYRARLRSRATDTAVNIPELRREIEQLLLAKEKPEIAVEASNSRSILEAVEYSSQYFLSAVRYLGPLRDEPKPIYPLEALVNPTEVGYKGEHTAAVLDLHRDTQIRYIPSTFIKDNKIRADSKYSSLHDAVVDWLAYVGVASEVTTSDSGKFGHQLRVQTEGLAQFHDLTNVGVGVSQVLPIIVMALLAEPPTLLIFEQPELHLHPKVQARLADFFLSVSLIGKQCLLETHSEYLIERFRRRVAEATGDSLTSVLKIYFTERAAGSTKCREVHVSKYGAIADWPQDFFDQSQIETELILKAANSKRTSERRG